MQTVPRRCRCWRCYRVQLVLRPTRRSNAARASAQASWGLQDWELVVVIAWELLLVVVNAWKLRLAVTPVKERVLCLVKFALQHSPEFVSLKLP